MDLIRTKKAELSLTSDRHIKILVAEDAEVGLQDIMEINEAKNQLANGGRYCVVFCTPEFGHISNEARRYSASRDVYHNAIAKAIVVKSCAMRLIVGFFIKVDRPPSPTRIFSNEGDAVAWLNAMVKAETQVEFNSSLSELQA